MNPETLGYKIITANNWGQIDPCNDSQLIFYDQTIPCSTILGYMNTDHMTVSVPIARNHAIVSAMVLNKNVCPREVMMETILRYVETDL